MFSIMDADEEAHLHSCIQGYHVYNAIWSATVGEELQCVWELGNAKDGYTISVLRGSDVVGHLPQKISRINTSGGWNIAWHVLITSQILHGLNYVLQRTLPQNKIYLVKTK